MGENGERKRGCVVVKCLAKNVVRWEGRRGVETKNGAFHQKPSVEKKKKSMGLTRLKGGISMRKSGWRKFGGEREAKKEMKEKKRIKNKNKIK